MNLTLRFVKKFLGMVEHGQVFLFLNFSKIFKESVNLLVKLV